jgi:hypothetical protein
VWHDGQSCADVNCDDDFCNSGQYYCACPENDPPPFPPAPKCCDDSLPQCLTCYDAIAQEHRCCCCDNGMPQPNCFF